MDNQVPRGLMLVALFQFIPPLMLPPSTFTSISFLVWLFLVPLFVLLGVSLVRGREWSRLATIFVQGFNVIVRLLVLISNAVTVQDGDAILNIWMVSTSLLSIILSAIVLYYIDRPEVQIVMR
ncbi:MAG: hypothetical protein U9R48_00415 [Chloroflexota bacterium]|nr:hypothetical protein [Chloroflexota bacterium]